MADDPANDQAIVVAGPDSDQAVLVNDQGALVAQPHDWQTIFHVSNQVVLYNPTSHALTIRHSPQYPQPRRDYCKHCGQVLPEDFMPEAPDLAHAVEHDTEDDVLDAESSFRASNYFHLLAIANETTSRPSTPPPVPDGSSTSTFPRETMAEGYFKAFFQEEFRLGMGANGSVYLCQHVLDGNPLGHFAVKKIAVGESHSYLLNILKEVRLLEQLHHPNIITYHHAWLETCQFSAFGPKIPTLHVLMQWAEGGSLDDFIDVRLGRRSPHIHIHPAAHLGGGIQQSPDAEELPTSPAPDQMSRSARIRAFREFQRAPSAERNRIREQVTRNRQNGSRAETWTAVHLLSAEEVLGLFRDVTEGLTFLHAKSILHLDLKPGNVLLTWDEGKLVPRAMLSDFGTSRDMLHTSRLRSGNTGTLEYTSPESLPSPQTGLLQPVDSKADMWSLGMILHKLLFFKSPYQYASDGIELGSKVGEDEKMDRLEHEVLSYPGFKSNPTLALQFDSRRLPRAFLVLLESLLHVTPFNRPSCERVVTAIREGKLNPASRPIIRRQQSGNTEVSTSLVPALRRASVAETLVLTKLPPSPPPATEIGAAVTEKASLLQLSGPEDERILPTKVAPPRRPISLPRLPRRSVLWMRSFKSWSVIIKIVTALSACPDGRPHWFFMSVVIFLSIVDSWFEELWVSVGFGLLHLFTLRFICWGSACCGSTPGP